MNARSIIYPVLSSLLVVAIVGGIVGVGFYKLQPPADAGPAAEQSPGTQPTTLTAGHDYYVLVKLVEFTPKNHGSRWDTGIDIAPDPKVLLYWQGQRVYQSSSRQDTFIATWDLFRVNIADLIRSGGDVDIASAINAPIIRYEPGGTITIEVLDSDVLSDDQAVRLKFSLDNLHGGDNALPLPADASVKRLIVQVIDRQTSIGDLINIAQAR